MLNQLDGLAHFFWSKNLGDCLGAYHSFSCLVGFPFTVNQFLYWFAFFVIIFVIMPLFLWRLTGNKWVVPGYFALTGIPWVFDALGFYSQFLLCFLFVFLVFEKSWKKRWLVIFVFCLFTSVRLILHDYQLFVLLTAIIIEFVVYLHSRFDFKKYFLLLIPFNVNTIKFVGYNRLVTGQYFFPMVQYYSYHLLVRPMLFVFSIPALLHIVFTKDWIKFCWLAFMFFGIVYTWFWQDFDNLSVVRIMVVFGFVLMPSFIEWVQKQNKNIKYFYFALGLLWFFVQLVSWGWSKWV